MKDFADDNLKFQETGRKLFKRVENTVGKGEIARYKQYILFPQCFQKACFPGASKGVNGLKVFPLKALAGEEQCVVQREIFALSWTENVDGWLVVLWFNATLTAKVISWQSVTHMCFLAFSHQY